MKVLTVEQLAKRLDDCFAALGGGSTSPLSRHRTLRATMDWSHELLSEPEQVMFRRLSVFAGGWTVEAAEGVCSGRGIEKREVLELLSELVNHSLVVVAKQGVAMRYRLLEPMRQYAAQRLRDAGEREDVRRRHAEWYLGLAEGSAPKLTGPQQAEWLDRLEEEQYNFQAAIVWSLERGDVEFQLRMAGGLRLYWIRRGAPGVLPWLERALAAGTGVEPAIRAQALQAASPMVQVTDRARAIKLREEALALWRELENRREIVRTLNNLGEMEWERGNVRRARCLLGEALALARGLEEQDRYLIAVILHALGRVALQEDLYDEAKGWLTESLSISRDAGYQDGIGFALHALARVALRQGDVGAARRLAGEGLVLFQRLGYRAYIAYCLESLAEVEAATGRLVRAVRLWAKAAALRLEALNIRPRCEEPEHERQLVAARADLGTALFDRAWAEGQAMTVDEAMSYALSLDRTATDGLHDPANLSDRERQIASLIAQGLSNRQIAEELGIAEGTAAVHVHNILKKLGLASREDIPPGVAEQGLVPPSGSHEGGTDLTRTAS
jgi:non-specific serine/threonine protein kinase